MKTFIKTIQVENFKFLRFFVILMGLQWQNCFAMERTKEIAENYNSGFLANFRYKNTKQKQKFIENLFAQKSLSQMDYFAFELPPLKFFEFSDEINKYLGQLYQNILVGHLGPIEITQIKTDRSVAVNLALYCLRNFDQVNRKELFEFILRIDNNFLPNKVLSLLINKRTKTEQQRIIFFLVDKNLLEDGRLEGISEYGQGLLDDMYDAESAYESLMFAITDFDPPIRKILTHLLSPGLTHALS